MKILLFLLTLIFLYTILSSREGFMFLSLAKLDKIFVSGYSVMDFRYLPILTIIASI